MRIADWPIERVRWLWVGVTVYLAALIVVAVTLRGNHQGALQQPGAVQSGPPGPQTEHPLTPAEQARVDSLLDSLRVAFRDYAHSAQGHRDAAALGEIFRDIDATGRRMMLIVLAIALSPVVIAASLTMAWYRARGAPGSAGA